jgi:hypothetical protein
VSLETLVPIPPKGISMGDIKGALALPDADGPGVGLDDRAVFIRCVQPFLMRKLAS